MCVGVRCWKSILSRTDWLSCEGVTYYSFLGSCYSTHKSTHTCIRAYTQTAQWIAFLPQRLLSGQRWSELSCCIMNTILVLNAFITHIDLNTHTHIHTPTYTLHVNLWQSHVYEVEILWRDGNKSSSVLSCIKHIEPTRAVQAYIIYKKTPFCACLSISVLFLLFLCLLFFNLCMLTLLFPHVFMSVDPYSLSCFLIIHF